MPFAARLWLTLTAVLFAAPFALPPAAHADGTILTVAGNVSKPNRDGLHEFTDAFLNFQQKSFDKARGFSSADLAALPQVTISARAEAWPGTLSLSGPRLSDVMEAAGAWRARPHLAAA